MKPKPKNEETWKPVVLSCIFVFFGLSNLLVVFYGGTDLYGYGLGDFGTLIVLIFSFLFFGVAWGFFKRKPWSVAWGYGTGILNLIAGLITSDILLMGLSVFIIWLTYSARAELTGQKEANKKNWRHIVTMGMFTIMKNWLVILVIGVFTIILIGSYLSQNSQIIPQEAEPNTQALRSELFSWFRTPPNDQFVTRYDFEPDGKSGTVKVWYQNKELAFGSLSIQERKDAVYAMGQAADSICIYSGFTDGCSMRVYTEKEGILAEYDELGKVHLY